MGLSVIFYPDHVILPYRMMNILIILHAVRKHAHTQFSLATRTAPTLQNLIRRRSFPEVTADKCSQREHTFVKDKQWMNL